MQKREQILLDKLRNHFELSLSERLELIVRLSIPAMMAQLAVIVMFYIDASMVGSLGASASAAIGILTSTTWLFNGLCSSVVVGFSVQVAQRIGASQYEKSRSILRQAILCALLFGVAMSIIGISISFKLPYWLGATEDIIPDAQKYFLIYSLAMPCAQLYHLCGSMLRSSGNMKFPSMMSFAMCILDIVFNYFLIFDTHEVNLFGLNAIIPGAGLKVTGAALGTALAYLTSGMILYLYLTRKSRELAIYKEKGSYRPEGSVVKEATRIGFPIALENAILCCAQITLTVIVAPLGAISIAANSFGITAESLCYMPGFGIGDAATTIVGQSKGAGARQLMRSLARMTTYLGMFVMALMGVVLYFAAPYMMALFTPVEEIRDLGVEVLRIEAFAEPLYGASIVACRAFVGAGDTLIPSIMNLSSIWLVRVSLAAILAPVLGLKGVWIAMCIELCFRGTIFLVRLYRERWMNVKK